MDGHTSDTHLINTAPLRAAVEHMIAAALSLVASAAPLRKQCAAINKMAKFYRLLIVMERYNRDKLLRANMLSNPSWCQRVFFQLGGHEAAQRWRRRERATRRLSRRPHNTPRDTAKPHHQPSAPAGGSCRRYKTDERGQFRFAPITRGPNDFVRGNGQAALRARADSPMPMKPIPIFPHEFETALRTHNAPNASGGVSPSPPDIQCCHKDNHHSGPLCHNSGTDPTF